jgi:predicted transcriptional regulator
MEAANLIDRLKSVSAPRLAAASGVSVKTIYRIRLGETSPTMRTVDQLMRHIDSVSSSSAQLSKT